MNPVVDDSFPLPRHIFCPRRDPVDALAIIGVNNHLSKQSKQGFILQDQLWRRIQPDSDKRRRNKV